MRESRGAAVSPQKSESSVARKLLFAVGIVFGLSVSGWGFATLPGVYRHVTYEVADGHVTGIVDACIYREKVAGIRSTYLNTTGAIPCSDAERMAAAKEGKANAQVFKVRLVSVDYALADGRQISSAMPVRLAGGYDLKVGSQVQLQYHPDTPRSLERRMANPFALSWQGQYGIEAPPPPTTAPKSVPHQSVQPGTTRYYVFATLTAILFATALFAPLYLLWRVVKWARGRTGGGPPPPQPPDRMQRIDPPAARYAALIRPCRLRTAVRLTGCADAGAQ